MVTRDMIGEAVRFKEDGCWFYGKVKDVIQGKLLIELRPQVAIHEDPGPHYNPQTVMRAASDVEFI